MTQQIPEDFRTHKRSWRSALEMAVNTAENQADRSYWKHELEAFDKAYGELDAQPESPWGYDVHHPLEACVWLRESTQEWVLEIRGTINDTDLSYRHTAAMHLAPEDVPGLEHLYPDVDFTQDDEPVSSTGGPA